MIGLSVLALAILAGCLPESGQRKSSSLAETSRRPEALVAECALCHSTIEAQRGPILNGMDHWYLLEQIQKFRSGVRGQNPENRSEYLMGVAAKKIPNDYEMAFLANWFAKQKPLAAVHTVPGDPEMGADLYAKRCASCHGENAEGKRETFSPSLTRMEGWYFLDQMRKFRSGLRGKSPADLGGQVMAAASVGLTNQQLRDIVAYVVEAFGPPRALSLREQTLQRFSEGREGNATDEKNPDKP